MNLKDYVAARKTKTFAEMVLDRHDLPCACVRVLIDGIAIHQPTCPRSPVQALVRELERDDA